MLELTTNIIIGIDLAGKAENPTGWAIWEHRTIKTRLIRNNNEIIEGIARSEPSLIAIDAPFRLPRRGIFRKADKEMITRGYRVFPPTLPAMRKLTVRAVKINKLIAEKGYKTIEAHPASTRKALKMPTKDWRSIQTILKNTGLQGDLQSHILTSHEIDAITCVLTAYLHTQFRLKTGDAEGGYIIIPRTQDWRTLKYE
jgi:predicted nuclease with RNAse H fold